MEIDPIFWRNKNVFLTGHTGFKGSWLSLWLQKLGSNVTGYSLAPPTNPNLFTLAEISKGMTSIEGDVRDFHNLKKCMFDSNPEIVFHVAAQSLVRRSYKHPIETYSTNVMGTVNFLEVVRFLPNVRAVLIVTSDKCYNNDESGEEFCEEDRIGGWDPYSSSKGCAEIVSSAYRKSFFDSHTGGNQTVAIATARAGNVIGGGDWSEDRLVPDIISAVSNNEPLMVRNPDAVRPWQYVLEPLRGYLLLTEKLHKEGQKFAEAWNFGSEDFYSVRSVIEQLGHAWGSEVPWNLDSGTRVHEAPVLKLNSSKANNRLGWKQTINLKSALKYSADWHKAYLLKSNMSQYTLDQLKAYEEILSQEAAPQ